MLYVCTQFFCFLFLCFVVISPTTTRANYYTCSHTQSHIHTDKLAKFASRLCVCSLCVHSSRKLSGTQLSTTPFPTGFIVQTMKRVSTTKNSTNKHTNTQTIDARGLFRLKP